MANLSAAAALDTNRFERNDGQCRDLSLRYLLSGDWLACGISDSGFRWLLRDRTSGRTDIVTMQHLRTNSKSRVTGETRLAARYNYFLGSDPKSWIVDVPTFKSARSTDLWPSVDTVCRQVPGGIEWDYEIRPGGRFEDILFSFDSAHSVRLDGDDELKITTSVGELNIGLPRVWQEIDGRRVSRHARFRYLEDGVFGFDVAGHDPSHRLVIDPVVSLATRVGGPANNAIFGTATDAQDATYVCGETTAADFLDDLVPSLNPAPANIGAADIFVTKIDASNQVVYNTFIGGNAGDVAVDIAVDAQFRASVIGTTLSPNFPLVTPLATNGVMGGAQDVCVFRLNAAGSAFDYSTYFGGAVTTIPGQPPGLFPGRDVGRGLALAANGDLLICGDTFSTDLPIMFPIPSMPPTNYSGAATSSPGFSDVFVARLNFSTQAVPALSLVYSTYLGGFGSDSAGDVAEDPSQQVVVCGATSSVNFPQLRPLPNMPGPLAGGLPSPVTPATAVPQNIYDAFVTRLAVPPIQTSALIYSTYLGGRTPNYDATMDLSNAEDYALGLAIPSSNAVVVCGETFSSDFVSAGMNAIQPNYVVNNLSSGFMTRLQYSPTAQQPLSVTASTYILNATVPIAQVRTILTDVAVDTTGAIYAVGTSSAPALPIANALQGVAGGGRDLYVLKTDAFLGSVTYASYFGGSLDESSMSSVTSDGPSGALAIRPDGNVVHIGGTTNSTTGLLIVNPLNNGTVPSSPIDGYVVRLNDSDIAVSSNVINFGGWKVSFGTPTTRTLVLSNTGTASLNVTGAAGLTPPFTLTGITPPAVIPPGGTLTVTLSFLPTALGAFNQALTITSDDLDEPTIVVSVRGLGI